MDNVVDFQIPVDDMARAKKFYNSVFGWKLDDIPGMNYTSAITVPIDEKHVPTHTGAINGGMMTRSGVFKAPVVTINVSDIDKAMQKVVKAGGKIAKEKQAIMDMAYLAYIEDTEGNITALWQPIKK